MKEISKKINDVELKIMADVKSRILRGSAIESAVKSKAVRAQIILTNEL
jgi:hypothetical protein